LKKGIHPDYHPVVFVDSATGDEILTRSTIISDEKREIEGVTHYVVYCDIHLLHIRFILVNKN